MNSSLACFHPRFWRPLRTSFSCIGACFLLGCNGGHCDGRECKNEYIRAVSGDYKIFLDSDSSASVEIDGKRIEVPVFGDLILRFEDETCLPRKNSPCRVDVKSVSLTIDEFEFTVDGKEVRSEEMEIDTVPGSKDDYGEGVWWFDGTNTCAWDGGPGRNAETEVVRFWSLELDRDSESATLSTTLQIEMPSDDRCGLMSARIDIAAHSGPWRREL